MTFRRMAIGLSISLVAVASTFAAAVPSYTLFGDAEVATPGYNSPTSVQLRSDAEGLNYGGIDFSVPAGLTVADLDQLSTFFMFMEGSCGGGAPRFQVGVTNGTTSGNIFVYLGNPPNYTNCPQNVWLDSGNLLEAADLVDATQIGGTFYQPYSSVQTQFGTFQIESISLVTDGSFAVGTQTVLVDDVNINGTTTSFETVDSCKNGGFSQFTSAPGPFRNQGQCVSYFVRNR